MTADACDRCGTPRPEYAGLTRYAYARLCAPCLADLASRATQAPTAPLGNDAQHPEDRPPASIPPLEGAAPPALVPTCTQCGMPYTPEHAKPHWSDGCFPAEDMSAVPSAHRAAPTRAARAAGPVRDPVAFQDGQQLAYARLLDFLDRLPAGTFDAATVLHFREAVLAASLLATAQ